MMKSYFLNSKGMIYNIPTPSSISYFWNFGSLLGVNLMVQIITGIFLSFHYSSFLNEAFFSVIQIMDDLPYGWLVRSVHANGASFFFIFIYFHIGRGLFMSSFKLKLLWFSGVMLLMSLMGTAFVGYVLPWGQMSLWGATVITNLLSALPWVGSILVEWVWGGFSVSGPTLVRFFSAHFVLPMVIVVIVMLHIILLHSSGSGNPLGLGLNSDKIYFHPYFTTKDGIGGMWMCFTLLLMSVIWYDMFMDPDNFIPANPMVTPPHIQPEWYFLFAYSILRSVPTKLGGVILLLLSILCLLFLPFLSLFNFRSGRMVRMHKIFVVNQVFTFGLLTWLGAMPVEGIFPDLGKVLSVVYFFNMMMIGILG